MSAHNKRVQNSISPFNVRKANRFESTFDPFLDHSLSVPAHRPVPIYTPNRALEPYYAPILVPILQVHEGSISLH